MSCSNSSVVIPYVRASWRFTEQNCRANYENWIRILNSDSLVQFLEAGIFWEAYDLSYERKYFPEMSAPDPKPEPPTPVNINDIPEKNIQRIPGVGPKTHKKIIEARQNGPITESILISLVNKGNLEKM